jgi:hydroxyacylglutathione hydrolase
VLAVDPGDAAVVGKILAAEKLTVASILVTHGHYDHTAGVAELKKKTGCQLIAGDSAISGVDKVVADGDTLAIGDVRITVLATPGHTSTSVCYFVESDSGRDLFTGDTMFVGGCGRILTGEPPVMWRSLQQIACLPDETRVWPGHDYTIENYEFALTIEPDNEAVKHRLHEVKEAAATIPSTIGIEKHTNIFLRADEECVKVALGMKDSDEVQVFAELRRRKDVF